jgi:hypothetical protein
LIPVTEPLPKPRWGISDKRYKMNYPPFDSGLRFPDCLSAVQWAKEHAQGPVVVWTSIQSTGLVFIRVVGGSDGLWGWDHRTFKLAF